MAQLQTDLVKRLQANDSQAWYELWDTFGPTIERMVHSIARRVFTQETVADLRQETLLRLSSEIGRFDHSRGVKFTTWLYGIARHVVLNELTFRNAKKRNSGVKPASIEAMEGFDPESDDVPVEFEASVFRAIVFKAVEIVQGRVDLMAFEAWQMKALDDKNGKDIASELGVSEPSISRYLRKVRDELRQEIARSVAAYTWTQSEEERVYASGLDKSEDDAFDEALMELYLQAEEERKTYHRMADTGRAMSGRMRG